MRPSVPATANTCQKISDTFIHVGGTLGPLGTVLNSGPVTHRPRTNTMNASTSPPNQAHHRTGGAPRRRSPGDLCVVGGMSPGLRLESRTSVSVTGPPTENRTRCSKPYVVFAIMSSILAVTSENAQPLRVDPEILGA